MSLAVVGHSYTTGEAAADWKEGFVETLDASFDGLSLCADDFSGTDSLYTSDSFNRSDSTTTLGSTDGGTTQAWTALTGTWGIASNNGYCATAHGTKANVAYVDLGHDDFVLDLQIGTAVTGMGFAFRIQDDANMYIATINTGATSFALVKVVAGVTTSLGSVVIGIGAGTRLQVVGKGNVFNLNSGPSSTTPTHRLTVTDSTYPTGTKHGLRTGIGSVTPRFDNCAVSYPNVPSTADSPTPTQLAGAWVVRGGSLVNLAAWNNSSRGIIAWDTGEADGTLEMTYGSWLRNGNTGVMAFRIQDIDNCLLVRGDFVSGVSSAVSLYKRVAGVETLLTNLAGSSSIASFMAANDRIKVTFTGTRVRLWANNRTAGNPAEYDVTEFTTATKVGFWTGAADPQILDYRAFRFSKVMHLGRAGSSLAPVDDDGGWVPAIRYLNRLGAGDVAVVLHHLNDLPSGTGDRALKALRESTRSVVSHLVARAAYTDADSSCAYSAGWSTVTTTTINDGAGYHSCATVGRTVTISVPSSFLGGTVAIRSIAVPSDGGAQCSVTVDGFAAAGIDTSGIWSSGSNYAPMVTRLTNLAAGVHTVVVTIDAVDGAYLFDGWLDEPQRRIDGPRVVVCNVARLPSYSGYLNTFGDTQVNACNLMIAQVADEFPVGMVLVGDLDGVMNP